VSNAERHLSAEEIHDLLRTEDPGIGLATVYRTLDLLEELEFVHRMDFGDGRGRYELSTRKQHHHHHLVCLGCGSIDEVKADLLHQLEKRVAQDNCFVVVDHRLQFYGYCSNCTEELGKRVHR